MGVNHPGVIGAAGLFSRARETLSNALQARSFRGALGGSAFDLLGQGRLQIRKAEHETLLLQTTGIDPLPTQQDV